MRYIILLLGLLLTITSVMMTNADNISVTKFAIGPFSGSFNLGGIVNMYITGPTQESQEDNSGYHFKNVSGYAEEYFNYNNFTEYDISIENTSNPDQSGDILFDAYETNVTSLIGIGTEHVIEGPNDWDGKANYTNQSIDGKPGIVMEGCDGCDDPFSGVLREYGAAFYITPKIVCSIKVTGADRNETNQRRETFWSLVRSIHVNFDGRDPSRFHNRYVMIGKGIDQGTDDTGAIGPDGHAVKRLV